MFSFKKIKWDKKTYIRFIIVGVLVIVFLLIISKTYNLYKKDLPSLAQLRNIEPNLSTKIYSDDSKLIQEFYTERRIYVPLRKVSKALIDALLATEDRRFYHHWGVNLLSAFRALINDLARFKFVQGGSTITQQLARTLFLTREKTLPRKIKEVLTAIKIERNYSKNEILEMYLNQCYFGKGAYGVQSAAKVYFNKDLDSLTISECAFLIGLLKAPGRYSPEEYPQLALSRRNLVLNSLKDYGKISKQLCDSLKNFPLEVNLNLSPSETAPYFGEMIRQYLMEKYGEKTLYTGGLSVYTTLKADLQKKAEEVLTEKVKQFQKTIEVTHSLRDKNYTVTYLDTIDGKIEKVTAYKQLQGALVALDNSNGNIIAMVGGKDFKQSEFNRAVQALRQPGSAFKPFVFTAAIDNGYTPVDIIYDSPIILMGGDGREWRPENIDHTFKGPMTLREALRISRNLVSIKLLQKINPQQAVFYATKMGIKTPLSAVPSLAIGTSEVTLLQATDAFSVFPNHGIRVEPRFILKIVDRYGNVLEENSIPKKEEVLSEQTAYIMTTMLQTVIDAGTGYATRLWGFDRPAGGKTGTSDEYMDNWFFGFTSQITCGVWVGFDDKTKIGEERTGAVTALPIWTEFMKEAHKNLPVKDFEIPSEIVFRIVCLESGGLATDKCPKIIKDVFTEKTEPKEYCHIHKGKPLPEDLDIPKFKEIERKPEKSKRIYF